MEKNPDLNGIKHLLVDLDGTLLGNRSLLLSVDFTRRAVKEIESFAGKRHAIRTLYAMMSEFKRPSKEHTNDTRVLELFSKRMKIDIEDSRKLIRDGLFKLFPELKRHFFPVAGAKDFLTWAKEHYTLILATNPVWPPEIQELRVKWAGIDPSIFKSVTHVRRMKACKPEPQYFQEILTQEELDPAECLMIGDEVKLDLGATKVGIKVFIVGDYKKCVSLKTSKNAAPAWRGNYKHLRSLLESSENSG